MERHINRIKVVLVDKRKTNKCIGCSCDNYHGKTSKGRNIHIRAKGHLGYTIMQNTYQSKKQYAVQR